MCVLMQLIYALVQFEHFLEAVSYSGNGDRCNTKYQYGVRELEVCVLSLRTNMRGLAKRPISNCQLTKVKEILK